METHKINGIELLMPLVPKSAFDFIISKRGNLIYYTHYEDDPDGDLGTLDIPESIGYTILGTCWREGDKLVGFGFDLTVVFPDGAPEIDSWLRSKGITIPEGMKAVIIKVN